MFLPLAQVDIIQDNIDVAKNTTVGWHSTWEFIYSTSQPSGLWLSVVDFASVAVSLSFLWFAVGFASEAFQKRTIPPFRHLLWLLVALVLLSNHAAPLASATLGMRRFIDDKTQRILTIEIGPISMQSAIKDVLVTADVKNQIQAEISDCEAKTGQAQIDCFDQGGKDAQKAISDAEQKAGPLAGVRRFWDRFQRASAGANSNQPNPYATAIMGSLAEAAVRQVLKACQWAFANGAELAMLVTGLMGPLAVAISSIPSDSRPLWKWLSGFWGLAIMLASYNIMVGLAATVIVLSNGQEYSDIGFLVLIGLVAPFFAFRLGQWGGIGLLEALTGLAARFLLLL